MSERWKGDLCLTPRWSQRPRRAGVFALAVIRAAAPDFALAELRRGRQFLVVRRLARMVRIASIVGLFGLCLTTSGCFPYHYTIRPGLSGTVVNAQTHAPLAGAGICFGTNTTAVALSASDGSFHVPPGRAWGVWAINQDVASPTRGSGVNIRHTGYESYSTVVVFSPTKRGKGATKQIGVIPLIPLQP